MGAAASRRFVPHHLTLQDAQTTLLFWKMNPPNGAKKKKKEKKYYAADGKRVAPSRLPGTLRVAATGTSETPEPGEKGTQSFVPYPPPPLPLSTIYFRNDGRGKISTCILYVKRYLIPS
jgi:hypothetical protein